MAGEQLNMLSGVRALLRGAKLAHITRDQEVCVLNENMALNTALRCLAGNNILSAPVMQGTAGDPEEPIHVSNHKDLDVMGFVDVRDILLSFLEGLDTDHLLTLDTIQQMEVLEQKGILFCKCAIKDVTQVSQDGHFLHSAQTKASLWEVVFSNMLHPRTKQDAPRSRPNSGHIHHRMAIFNSKYQLTQVVSQSDIIRYVYKQRRLVPDALAMNLSEIPGLQGKHVVTVPETSCAFEALVLMQSKKISAVAVVDKDGQLVGNFSTSELRSIMTEEFGALALPVTKFLAPDCSNPDESSDEDDYAFSETPNVHEFVKRKSFQYRSVSGALPDDCPNVQPAAQATYLREDATFGDLLYTLATTKAHRVYTVDDRQRPTGVTTLTDVLFAISGEDSLPY